MNKKTNNLPISLMIGGSQKSGTTSLMYYLTQHPQIQTHHDHEIGYFVNNELYEKGYDWNFETYFQNLKEQNTSRSLIAAKNVWMLTQVSAIKRLFVHNSTAILVFLLRNPIDRAYSSYWYARRNGWEDLHDFETALFADTSRLAGSTSRQLNCQYLNAGNYIQHLKNIEKHFPKEQIHVFLLSELKHHPAQLCRKIFNLLPQIDQFTPNIDKIQNKAAKSRSERLSRLMNSRGENKNIKRFAKMIVPNSVRSNIRLKIQNLNEKEFQPPPMAVNLRQRLRDFYHPLNKELERYLKVDLSGWD